MENFVFHNENSSIDKNEKIGEHADGGDGEQVHALKINESAASCLFSLKTSGNTLFYFHATAKQNHGSN